MRGIRFCIWAACLAFASGAIAAPPDFIEDFTSFDGIDRVDQTSPNDTGSSWRTLPLGPTTSAFGYQRSDGLVGSGITWQGAEQTAIIGQDQFPILGGANHMVAFGVQFSRATAGTGTEDFAEVFSAIPIGVDLLDLYIVNYVVGVGKLNTSQQGIIVFLPTSLLGTFEPYMIPAPIDQWNLVVIQYEPASSLLALNAEIRVWVNPSSPTAAPDLSIASSANLIGSFFGNGPLGRFGLGDTTNMLLTRRGSGDDSRSSRSGTSGVKVDRIGGWQGYDGSRSAGSLGDAMSFLTPPSSVADWEFFE